MPFLPRLELDVANELRWSVAALVFANLLPLVGVLFFGWQTFDVVFLYWLENVVIGLIALPKMAIAWGKVDKHDPSGPVGKVFSKLFSLPFFCFHYGLFCMGHGAFLFELLTPASHPQHGKASSTFMDSQVMLNAVLAELSPWQVVAVTALAASHLVSFLVNYLGRGEWRERSTGEMMFAPYPRIMLLHVALLVGGVLSLQLGSPVIVLVLLVAGKTLLDYGMHLAEHEAASEHQSSLATTT